MYIYISFFFNSRLNLFHSLRMGFVNHLSLSLSFSLSLSPFSSLLFHSPPQPPPPYPPPAPTLFTTLLHLLLPSPIALLANPTHSPPTAPPFFHCHTRQELDKQRMRECPQDRLGEKTPPAQSLSVTFTLPATLPFFTCVFAACDGVVCCVMC